MESPNEAVLRRLRGHRRRQGRHLRGRPTARPVTRAAASWRPGRRPRPLLPRARHDPPRRRRLVADDWKDDDTAGICTQSVVVMVVRKGNPENIDSWDDLVKHGVEIITPNPASSGSAQVEPAGRLRPGHRRRWQRGRRRGVHGRVLRHTVALPGSGRDATTAFTQRPGRRPALLRERGDPGPPERRRTSTTSSAGHDPADREPVRRDRRRPRPGAGFLDFQSTEEGQKLYAAYRLPPAGRRRRRPGRGRQRPGDPFPEPSSCSPSTTTSAAGPRPTTTFFDEAKRATPGIITEIQSARRPVA